SATRNSDWRNGKVRLWSCGLSHNSWQKCSSLEFRCLFLVLSSFSWIFEPFRSYSALWGSQGVTRSLRQSFSPHQRRYPRNRERAYGTQLEQEFTRTAGAVPPQISVLALGGRVTMTIETKKPCCALKRSRRRRCGRLDALLMPGKLYAI